MTKIMPKLALLILLTAVFSVVTSGVAYASTNESNGGEEGIEGDEGPTPPSEAAAPAVSTEEEEEDEDRTFDVQCWNGELVDDIDDCPVDEGSIVCDDGTFAVRISDCPTGSSPPPADALPFPDGDENNNGIQDYAEEEDYEPNPYCDLVSDEYMSSGGTCHDRKDYYQGGPNDGLYPCNDGTNEEDWRDCKDASA